MNLIRRMPVPVCALALALASLGNLAAPHAPFIKPLLCAMSGTLLALFTIRVLLDVRGFAKELDNPGNCTALPAYTMTLMLLVSYAAPYWGEAAREVWLCVLVLHFHIVLIFIKKFVVRFDIRNVYPSWFVPAVGFVTASVTAPAVDMRPLGQVLFVIGLAVYVLTLVPVLYRVFVVKQIPEHSLPTLAVFTSPVNLCMAGYMQSFEQKSLHLTAILAALCVICYLAVVALIVLRLLRLKFYPGLASLTYPMVVSAVSCELTCDFLERSGIATPGYLPELLLLVAAAAVLYVLARYAQYWMGKVEVEPLQD